MKQKKKQHDDKKLHFELDTKLFLISRNNDSLDILWECLLEFENNVGLCLVSKVQERVFWSFLILECVIIKCQRLTPFKIHPIPLSKRSITIDVHT